VTYTYNNFNQVTGISGFGGTVSPVSYHNSGAYRGLLQNFSFGNGQSTTLSYNNRRAMTSTVSPVLNLGFVYGDNRGNMTALTNTLDPTKNKDFAYDDLSRLDVFNAPLTWGNGTFNYQPDGDRSRKLRNGTINYGYISNRMTSATGISYGYNLDGDMISAGDLDFEYTPFHRMEQVVQDNNVLYSFGYDGNGQWVYRQSGSDKEIYLRGPDNHILVDIDVSGPSKMEYIYLNGKMVVKSRPDPNGDLDEDGLTLVRYTVPGT